MPPPPAPANAPTHARRRLPLAALGLVLLFAGFVAGVVHLFQLRFDAGDIYPPYSTLRGDPLGAKVFFASLQALPGLSVERSLRPTSLLGVPAMSRPGADHGEARMTCFFLGVSADDWPYLLDAESADRLRRIASLGGRVVVTFLPTTHAPTVEGLEHARKLHAPPDPKKDKEAARRWPVKVAEGMDLSEDWGIDFRRVPAAKKPADPLHPFSGPGLSTPAPEPAAGVGTSAADGPLLARDGRALPVRDAQGVPVVDDARPVAWHTAADFDLDAPAARHAGWRALYERAGHPVIVERTFPSGGTLVLASDTYLLSNEGLQADPHPTLLAALVGPGRHLLFDESHLGIREHPGLMTLARRYRLQGVLAALCLLAGLFVWRNTVSLVPPRAAGSRAEEDALPVTGRAAAEGFFNLLRRGVAPRDLSALCLAQWQQHLAPRAGRATAEARQTATPENTARLQEILAGDAARSSPAALYRAMCAALRRS